MSIAASAWAKKVRTGSSARKALLMVLAEYATIIDGWDPGDGRHYAWPGQARLMTEVEMGERALRDHLAALEAAGLICRVRRGGEGVGRRPDVVILAVDDDGPRPFPVGNPVDASVDDDVDKGNRQNPPVGATGRSEQGNRQNRADAPYIEPPSEQAAPKRGTRLPEPFEVTESMRSWYRENIGAAVDGALEHEKFLDYWRSRTGQIAVKKDWPAAWRNWMRTALERAPRDYRTTGSQKPAAPRFPTAQERSQQHLSDFAALAKEAEDWIEAQGGDPNDGKLVFEVMERIKRERNGSATRTAGMYSGWKTVDGEVVGPKEVTAGEAT